jgi:hypothetical protein
MSSTRREILSSLLLIALVCSTVLAAPTLYRWWVASNSGISIENVSFILKEDGRYVDATVKAIGSNTVEVASAALNGSETSNLSILKPLLGQGETTEIEFMFYWLQGKTYIKQLQHNGSLNKASLHR